MKPVLIGLYDSKLLGLRYLSASLKISGYEPEIIFLKTFTSYNTQEPTAEEYALLFQKIEELKPDIVGISVMCSFYLEVAKYISQEIKKRMEIQIIWGGVYATLFPRQSLDYADVVIRGEGEEVIVELIDAISKGEPYEAMENLCYKKSDQIIMNPIRPLIQDLDRIPFPDVGHENKYYIQNNKVIACDPALNSFSYELTGSRGCPNQCSYCSSSNIRYLYKGKGKYIRLRSVDNVIEEILYVKGMMPKLQMLRFWDEIFPSKEDWVEEFAEKYKRLVGLPFEVWGHPKHTKLENMKRLVDAGMQKIVVGIQSGSLEIRKNIYNRLESQESIIECSRVLKEANVPIVIYDFILDHPFETQKDLQETLELCMTLTKPFVLQLHGLSFLPGTAIEKIAVEKGVKTWEEIKEEQNRSLTEQYESLSWWRVGKGVTKDPEKIFWHSLIYFSQFPMGEPIINWALSNERLKKNPKMLLHLQRSFNSYLMFKMGVRKLKYMTGMR